MAFQAVTRARVLAAALALALAPPAGAQAQDKQPSTFGPVIGAALLCHDQIDNAYFYRYLSKSFGAPYKHEGGAYWFRTGEATLWGKPVTEVMVGDDTSELAFLAAVAEAPPDELEAAVRAASGVAHFARDASAYPLRVAQPGGTIVYYNTKSKIYCARFKSLPQPIAQPLQDRNRYR
jgi:hypothetical protein